MNCVRDSENSVIFHVATETNFVFKKMARGRKKSLKKKFLTVAIILVSLILILILIASPLTKYLIQKYDVKYTGREITVGRAYVNPLTGSVSLNNVRIFEQNSDSVFFYVRKFGIDLSILKLISGTYQVSSLKIDQPEINVIQTDSVFNFTDLIRKFAVTADTTNKEKLHLNVLKIKMKNGLVKYSGTKMPLHYTISDINFSSPGMYWNVDTVNGKFSLKPGNADLSGDFMFNMDSLNYRFSMFLRHMDLNAGEQLIKKYSANAQLRASVNMDLKAIGYANKPLNVDAQGRIEMDSFRLGNGPDLDYLALKRMIISFRDVNPSKGRFYFDSVFMEKPHILYQRFDSLDNFRRMFRSLIKVDTVEAVDTINMTAKILNSDYYINHFEIKDADIEFNDYSIAEKFSMAFRPFDLKADSVDKQNKRMKITVKSGIKPYGSFSAYLSMDPKNSKNLDLKYNLQDVSASSFNPYIVTYTSHQLDRGKIEIHGDWTVRDNNIRALNHFVVINPRTTEKVKGKETKKVPLPLIMAFIRERGSAIDYEIPITGKINDPKFHIGDIITDLLRNILVKPPTTPYRQKVKEVEETVEKTLSVRWRMRQYSISDDQEDFMKRISKFLENNPDAHLTAQPVYYEEKEKENILLFEAKKKYFLKSSGNEVAPLSKKDSSKVEKMSSRDKAFISYLDSSIKNPTFLTLQEKCYRYVGKENVDKQYKRLENERKQAFVAIFEKNKTADRIEILKPVNEVPFNWFSYYRIEYKGEIPETLKEGFQKLYEYNSEPPRRKFFQLRR
ncbi:MAG: DUF748 domain-containing protein [Methanosarcina sp.]